MQSEKRNFDKEAASWDENPVRSKMVKDVSQAIAKTVALRPDMDVLDFGCGTGLLSLQILPRVGSITGVDSSQGMLDQFNRKIAQLKLDRVKTVRLDLEQEQALPGKYDLIISNMTLHHIQRIEPFLLQLYNVLVPGGQVAISDLDPDEGKFHEDNTGVFHFGFDREGLRNAFEKAGFEDVALTDAAEVIKPGANGEMRRFMLFLLTARRK
ncbi:MAG: class I SAM-dependent methyltransferase [Desulfobacteraceae bacterium]|nr:class I SAM-dependent methyltransferase [Desulfobacteraceae bacterium]